MSKELYMDAHEELVDEYMEAHPGVDWQTAYDRTADGAYGRMTDRLADIADNYRAIAIEARSDATPKSDAAEGESAAIAQPLSPPLSDKEKD